MPPFLSTSLPRSLTSCACVPTYVVWEGRNMKSFSEWISSRSALRSETKYYIEELGPNNSLLLDSAQGSRRSSVANATAWSNNHVPKEEPAVSPVLTRSKSELFVSPKYLVLGLNPDSCRLELHSPSHGTTSNIGLVL